MDIIKAINELYSEIQIGDKVIITKSRTSSIRVGMIGIANKYVLKSKFQCSEKDKEMCKKHNNKYCILYAEENNKDNKFWSCFCEIKRI